MAVQSHPVHAPVRDVISYLTTVGHPNAEVRKFVNNYLEDAVRWRNAATGFPGYWTDIKNDGCHIPALSFDTIQVGMQKLNALLYEVMQDRNPNKEIPAQVFLLFSIVEGFYDYGVAAGNFVWLPFVWLPREGRSEGIKLGKNFPLISGPSVFNHKDEVHKAIWGKGWFSTSEKEKAFTRLWAFIVSLRSTMAVLAQEPILA